MALPSSQRASVSTGTLSALAKGATPPRTSRARYSVRLWGVLLSGVRSYPLSLASMSHFTSPKISPSVRLRTQDLYDSQRRTTPTYRNYRERFPNGDYGKLCEIYHASLLAELFGASARRPYALRSDHICLTLPLSLDSDRRPAARAFAPGLP